MAETGEEEVAVEEEVEEIVDEENKIVSQASLRH